MKAHTLYKAAFAIAATAMILQLWAPGQVLQWSGLFGLAFIVCLGGIIEAVNRCADALERRN